MQQTGQSSTYFCSAPPERSSGITMRSPHVGQTYAPSSAAACRRRLAFRFFKSVAPVARDGPVRLRYVSIRKPIFSVTCHSAILPSSMAPRVSVT